MSVRLVPDASASGVRLDGPAVVDAIGKKVVAYVLSMPPLEIRWRSDATLLPPDTDCILMHVLSESLVWGLGFTQAINARWPDVGVEMRRRKTKGQTRVQLGEVLWSSPTERLHIAHLVVEHAGRAADLLDLDALGRCLDEIATRALALGATVHTPPLGTGLAQARWHEVRPVLETRLVGRGVTVVVHCLGSRLPEAGDD